MTSPLNGPVESAARILILLVEAYPARIDLGRLVLLDHMMLYSVDFGGPQSPHPPVPVRVGELAMKYDRVRSGLQVLLRADLVEMHATSDGFEYLAADSAESFTRLLKSEQATLLSSTARWVWENIGSTERAESELAVSEVSSRWLSEVNTFYDVELREIQWGD